MAAPGTYYVRVKAADTVLASDAQRIMIIAPGSVAFSGRVTLNGRVARASAEVKPGDIIGISFGNRQTRVEVLAVQESVRKEAAADLFRYLPSPEGQEETEGTQEPERTQEPEV